MAYTTTTAVSTIPSYYHKKFVERLEVDSKLYSMLDKRPLPEGSGTTMYFPRVSSHSTTPSAFKGSEGTLVTPIAVQDVRVSATIETFRNAEALWDKVKLTALSTYLDQAVDEQASQAANVIDKRILEAAYGCNIAGATHGGSVALSDNMGAASDDDETSFSCIAASGTTGYGSPGFTHIPAARIITAADIRYWVAQLRGRNVRPFLDNGDYLLVVDSQTEMNIQADSTWQAAYQYTDPENMKKGLFGRYAGVTMLRDNNILVSACGSAGATVAFTLLLGKGALGVSELNGGTKTYFKESGPQDTYNPVNEFMTFGWKIHFVPKALHASAGLICAIAQV